MLFGKNKSSQELRKKKGHLSISQQEVGITILTPSCHFSGKLYCRGTSRIGGRIEGEVVSEGVLIIEPEAFISANIFADEVIVQGRVQGRLEAKERVELADGGVFEGDIITPALSVMEGAKFNGRSSMKLNPEEEIKTAPSIVEELHKKKPKFEEKSQKGKGVDLSQGDKQLELTVL
ncbi:MAG: polymer-forming cytoskeletal protein [Oligoflexales bacterium]|nr:polymer-forming cytoskeletal protein [Oligoflexales bacterium]